MFKTISSYTPTLKECWIMVVCVVVFGSILAFPATAVPEIHILSTLLTYILTLAPAFLYAYLKGKRGNYTPEYKINDPYFGKLHPVVLFLLLPLIYGAFIIAVEPINSIITTPEWFEELMKNTALGGNIFWSVITTCICAPILEELLCRGIMLRGMIETGMKPVKAILWSAFIFGVIHMNPWQALPAFLLGALFGWLYYKTRCIWIPVTLHVLNNSTSTLLFKIFPDLPASVTFKDLIGDPQLYFSIFALSIAILALTYFIISKFVGRRNEHEQETTLSA